MKIIVFSLIFILFLYSFVQCLYLWTTYQKKNIKEHIGSYYNQVNPTYYNRKIDDLEIDDYDPSLLLPTIIKGKKTTENIDLYKLFKEFVQNVGVCKTCNKKTKKTKKLKKN